MKEDITDWLINREGSIKETKDIYVDGKKVTKEEIKMEEDIKILEEICTRSIKDTPGTKRMKQAIENLIKRNKELEEENESLVRQYEYQGALMVNEYCSIKEVFELFIPKSKIKEKIEELEEEENYGGRFYSTTDVIILIKNLLKGERYES